jgi:hypothetical protein
MRLLYLHRGWHACEKIAVPSAHSIYRTPSEIGAATPDIQEGIGI